MMSKAETLITEHLDNWSLAIKAKSSAGRGGGKKEEFYGIKKLRGLILELAVRGLLVPQDANESGVAELLKESREERIRSMSTGTIKKEKPASTVEAGGQPFRLPSGWAWCRVVDSGDYINGLAFSVRDWASTGRPIIRIQNLSGRNAEFNRTLAEVDDSVVVNDGDVLVSWSATLDAYIWRGEQGVLNQHIFRVEPSRIIGRSYLYWLLKWVIRVLAAGEHSHGLVMAHINRGPFLAQPIGLPPLAEQHRIVNKVDELMALCDQLEQQQEDSARTHTTLVQALLGALTGASERGQFEEAWRRIESNFDILFTTESSIEKLKETILQLAVMGNLVEQNSKDEPAAMLIKRFGEREAALVKEKKIKKRRSVSQVQVEEKPFAIPKTWEWIRVNTAIKPEREISYGVIKLEAEPMSGGIPTLRCSDVKPRFLDLSSVRTVAPEIEAPYKRTRLEGGEVVLNIRGTLGGVALVPESLAGYNIAREVAMLAFENEVVGMFAVNVIASPYFWKMIEENLKGIAYRGLNLKILRELVIPLPPLAEQHRIVAKVDQLMILCDRLKECSKHAQDTQLSLASSLVEAAIH